MSTKPTLILISLLAISSLISGCVVDAKTENTNKITPSSNAEKEIPAVDVIRVTQGSLIEPTEYIGTTQPIKEIIIRSQAEGEILDFKANIGDRILAEEIIARLEDTLLQSEVMKAEAELGSLNAEVIQAQAEVESAKAEVESAKATWNQAQIDALRLENLFQEGAISQREVELARTTEKNALQAVKSAEATVNVRKAEVKVAQGQITTQKALIETEKKKLAYTQIKSPTNGYVLEKLTELGNLVRIGDEIVKIGDFSQVKVFVSVSELELGEMKPNQLVKVKLDAFPEQIFTGIIKRISPSADATVRQIPVEIILDNPNQLISSGLLARVKFVDTKKTPIIIPETALNLSNNLSSSPNNNSSVFIVKEIGNSTKVIQRKIILGENNNNKIEVLGGLSPQEKLVIRSSQPLENEQEVKLSIISEN